MTQNDTHDTDDRIEGADVRTARIFTLPFNRTTEDLRFRLRDEPDSLTKSEFSRNYVYRGTLAVDGEDEKYPLNRVWEAWNAGSGSECRLFEKTVSPSLSVGDVVFLDEYAYVCLPIGWEAITLEYDWLEATPSAEMLDALADMRAVECIEYEEGGDRIDVTLRQGTPDMLAETMFRGDYHFYEARSPDRAHVVVAFVSVARMEGLLMTEGETRAELAEAFESADEEAER